MVKRLFTTALLLGAVTTFVTNNAAKAAIELNNYTLNFVQAAIQDGVANPGALGITNLTGVDQWNFNARSFIGFNDNDSNNNISPGDTFDDYIAIIATGFEGGGDPLTAPGYGTTHQITAIAKFSGLQTGATSYAITGLDLFNIYFDAGTGAGFTPALFSNIAGTLVDGTIVETAALVAGTGTQDTALLPNGTTNLILNLIDQMDPGDFEFDFLDSNGLPIGLSGLELGLATTNNLLTGSTVASLGAYFGFNPGSPAPPPTGRYNGGTYDFGFGTSSGGQLNKQLAVVPEPGMIVIWSLLSVVGGAVLTSRTRRA